MLTRILLIMVLTLYLPACEGQTGDRQQPVFKEVPQIKEIRPVKPVKIKLKHSEKTGYSWEISGNDVDEIIRVNKKLHESLKQHNKRRTP